MIYDSKGILIDEDYSVVDKSGAIVDYDISRQTEMFMAGLSWMDFRTTFYILLANQCGFDMVLHPIRNSYEVNMLEKYSSIRGDCCSRIIIDAMNDKANDAINCILSPTQPLIMKNQLPMFSAWVASKCSDLKESIDIIYTIRGNKEFCKARDILRDLDHIHQEKGNARYVTETNLLISDFNNQMLRLMDTYGVNPSGINPVSSLISIYNISSIATQLPKIPNFNYTIKKPTRLKRLYRYSGFSATYKSIISDLVSIEKLGKYHNKLTSKVVLDDNAEYENRRQKLYKC